VSEDRAEEKGLQIKVSIELGELSSKQRGAVLGLIKDMGFAREEMAELVVKIIETDEPAGVSRRRKRK
jgi:hypothetical protein